MSAPVIVVSPEELARIVREAVRAELEARSTAANEPACEWIGDDDAARILGVKRDTLRKIRGLPVHRVGRRRRYRRAELDAWIARGRPST